MLRFLRDLFATHTETDEEFQNRMEQLQRDMDNLRRKRPEEVVGDPMEPLYYSLKMSESLEAREHKQARHYLHEMLRAGPTDSGLRLIASTAFTELGDKSEAIAQLGIGLALDSENYAIHHRLAFLLNRRGERKAAESVLETGWAHGCKHAAKRDLEAEREKYFSILNREDSA